MYSCPRVRCYVLLLILVAGVFVHGGESSVVAPSPPMAGTMDTDGNASFCPVPGFLLVPAVSPRLPSPRHAARRSATPVVAVASGADRKTPLIPIFGPMCGGEAHCPSLT
ncbi:hypothetical protein DFH09DRAFT_1166706 [Mycena vulgaris]|nr:hypothetical protein DFH09DRAFT_1210020 [Mycena vulgaris]KAJ6553820.1 hypothetical protein DFH09DRAFT_1166706 [Mycena vulgaris]